MLQDKFKLSKMNIFLIILNVLLVVLVIFAAVQLITSLKDTSHKIPDLETTAGKSSTREADATSTTSSETTTVSTKKVGNETSPYYNIDLGSILNEELVTKQILTQEEKTNLGAQYFKVLEGIFEGSDDDLINVTYLLTKAKDGEKDKLVRNDREYGIIYNGKELLSKIFTSSVFYSLTYYKYDETPALILTNDTQEYYKLGSKTGKKSYIVTSSQIEGIDNLNYRYKAIYYDVDYKEQGNKAPVYKNATVTIKYDSSIKRWKIDYFTFPNLKR